MTKNNSATCLKTTVRIPKRLRLSLSKLKEKLEKTSMQTEEEKKNIIIYGKDHQIVHKGRAYGRNYLKQFLEAE